MGIKVRNEKIDIVRGFAILLVVMGHTLSSIAGATDTFFYNVIFAVQMPLFMIISGYITIYSKPIIGITDFLKKIRRRTVALLLPWIVWTLIRYFLSGSEQSFGEYIVYILNNMDAGYWFLVSLWTIDLIVSFSSFFSNIGKQKTINKYFQLFIQFIYIGLFFAILGVIGYFVGMNVFAIKYSLYYLPYFCLGYLFGRIYTDISKIKRYELLSSVVVAIFGFVFVILSSMFNVYHMSDTFSNIALRMVISVSGCTCIFWTIDKTHITPRISCFFRFYGVHSLELYLVHYLFLSLVMVDGLVINSILGVISFIFNYFICLLFSSFIIYITNLNSITKSILYGKFKV